MIVISDENWIDYTHDSFLAGNRTGCLPRRVPFGQLPCAPAIGDRIKVIPEVEWKERIAEMDAKKAWPADYIRKYIDEFTRSQNGLNFCWAWDLSACIDVLNLMQGGEYIETAPESLGGAVTWRNDGNDMTSTLSWAMEHGIALRKFVPHYSLNPREFKAGWEADAATRKPVEVYDLGQGDVWAETVSALLQGYMIFMGVSWWEHALPMVRVFYESKAPEGWRRRRMQRDQSGLDDLSAEMLNSHGDGLIVFAGSRKIPTVSYGVFAIRTKTWEVSA